MTEEGAEMVLLWCVFLRLGPLMVRFVAQVSLIVAKNTGYCSWHNSCFYFR